MYDSPLAGQVRSILFYHIYNFIVNLFIKSRLMFAIAMYIPGSDKESRLLRKTLCKNCNLMAVLVFRSIADSVRSRLKTLDDVVKAGTFQIERSFKMELSMTSFFLFFFFLLL